MSPAAMHPPQHARDPIGWTLAVTLVFFVMCMVRLTIPTTPFFDEIHYLPAARAVIELTKPLNPEHPPLGKEILALGIALFGDKPLGWRIMPALFGTLGLFAAMRGMWFASMRRFATIACGVLLVTAFPLLIQSRIAMLDIFMASFVLVALWLCAGAVRQPETARWRLAVAGIALGLSMAAKWNAVPVAALPGLAFFAVRVRSAGFHALIARRGPPVPGMTLIEAGVWLGLVPILAYAAAYWPNFFYAERSISPLGLVEWHRHMFDLQEQVIKPHTYMSKWYQWVSDWRAIWYLYENIDGAQRGVLMVGNPVNMLHGLPAMLWCGWAGVFRKRSDALAVFVLYAVAFGMWIVAPKPVQFYYHYFLPSCFLMAGLALGLDALWQHGGRWRRGMALGVLAASCALFAYFWPILTAAPLADDKAFLDYAWIPSWR
jgi:dolichyl-phosphate-mannose--protein O-mannosyl transferase